MTLADVVFLVAYFLTAVMLGVSVIASDLHDRNRERAWRNLDNGTLIATPFVLLIIVIIAVHRPTKPAPPPAPALTGERPASSREVVRIGTNSLQTAAGGIAGRSSNWGTTRSDLDGTTIAVLAEEVPAITNDCLRFLAGGQLEVTWRLRDGLKWSDGKPLTASDIEFALAVSPDARIAEVRVLGPRDITIRYRDRVAKALEKTADLRRGRRGGDAEGTEVFVSSCRAALPAAMSALQPFASGATACTEP